MKIRNAARLLTGVLALVATNLATHAVAPEALQTALGFGLLYATCGAMIPLLALCAERPGSRRVRAT